MICGQALELVLVDVETFDGGFTFVSFNGGSVGAGGRGDGVAGGAPVYSVTVSLPVKAAWQDEMLGFPHSPTPPL